jgi:hypothetical protein
MKSRDLALMREVIGEDPDPHLLAAVCLSEVSEVGRALDTYFRQTQVKETLSSLILPAKRKRLIELLQSAYEVNVVFTQ